MADPAVITSRRHSLVKELSDIRDARDSPLMFMEGPRLVQEILTSNLPIELLVSTPGAETAALFKSAHGKAKRAVQVSESVFKAVSDVEQPQGILAIARCPRWTWKTFFDRSPAPIVILDGVQDPGNVSTIIRTAEAAGAAGLVTTPGTAHLYSPKALRASMGSTLRLPCLEHIPIRDIEQELKKNSVVLAAATMVHKAKDQKPPTIYTQFNWKIPAAILFGQEGKGISTDWGVEQELIYVPMQPPVESLNVAAAAAVVLYESFRQRANPA